MLLSINIFAMSHAEDYDYYSCMEDFVNYTIVTDSKAIGVIGALKFPDSNRKGNCR